jgi:hypothetical protein
VIEPCCWWTLPGRSVGASSAPSSAVTSIGDRAASLFACRASKTDQEGHGRTVAISGGRGTTCPVGALKDRLEAAQIANGPLFRPVTKGRQVMGRNQQDARSGPRDRLLTLAAPSLAKRPFQFPPPLRRELLSQSPPVELERVGSEQEHGRRAATASERDAQRLKLARAALVTHHRLAVEDGHRGRQSTHRVDAGKSFSFALL